MKLLHVLLFIIISTTGFSQTIADYIFTSTAGTYAEITGGTVSTAIGDDGTQTAIPIGFTFNYCGTAYTSFNTTTNGCVYLGSSFSYTNDLASTTYNPLIAGLWDDLYDDNNSDVSYVVTGTAPNRVLTVQWKNILWGRYTLNTALPDYRENFQIKLYETTNVIEIVYGSMNTPGIERTVSASVGINNTPGGSGKFLSVTPGVNPTVSNIIANNTIGTITYFTNGLTYRFAPSSCTSPSALTVANITTNQADASWTSTGNLWNIQYGLSGFAFGTGTIVTGLTAATYTIPSLNPSSTYQFYVQNDCGAEQSNWSGPYSFNTLCDITTALYTQNFDGVTTPALPNCWSKIVVGSAGTPTIGSSTTTPYSAPNCISMYNATSVGAATNLLLISPQFSDLAAGTNQIRFRARLSGTGTPVLAVGTMSNPTDAATFVPLQTFYDLTTNWQEYIITLASYSGTDQYIALKHGTGTTNQYIYIDNFKWEPIPTCAWPTAFTTTSTTSTSASFSWQDNAGASEWEIEYGATGFTPGTGAGTAITGITANPTTITGLTAQTTYQFYVRAICSITDQSQWTGPVTITTPCSEVTDFIENFDAVTTPAFPSCWYKVGTLGSANTSTTTPASAPNCLYLYSSSGTNQAMVAMQPVSNAGANTHQLRFKARGSTAGAKLEVGYLTNPTDPLTFTLIQSFTLNTTTFQEYIVYPGVSVGANTVMAFRAPGTPTYSIYIDDVKWEAKPSCTPPINIMASNVTTNSVDISWTLTGTETAWNIEYGLSGFTQGTGTVVAASTNPFTLTGLNPSSIYQFYIQSDCGGSDYSTWVGPISFTTLCESISAFPWSEGFEAVTIPAFPPCWFKENGDWVTTNNANTTYDADAHNGTQFLRDSYSATNEYIWTPGFTLVAGQSYDFSFWWAGDNYSYWVGDVFFNTSQVSTGATQIGTSFVTSSVTTSTTYKQEKYTFTPTTSGTYYMAIRVNCASSSPWYLSFDDFNFEPSPTCPRPTLLTAANMTQNSADVSWTLGSTESSWDVQYGPSGFTLGTGTIVEGVTNPYTISGLNPSTTYQYYVLAQCSLTDSSYWAGPFAFTTLCGPTTATYLQNFDGITTPNLPNCWNKIVVGSGGTPTITTVTTSPYSTPNCVQMYNATSVGASTHLILVSPQFSDMASGNNQVRFRAKMTGTGTPVLAVGTVSSPTNQASFTAIQTFYDLTTNWQEYVIPFSAYAGTDEYIAIKHGTGTTNQYIYIDNFTWEPIPTCPWPTAFNVTGLQDVQATFTWTDMAGASEWEIEYGPVGFVPGAGTIVTGITTNPYTVTGLTSQTAYDFYVRAVCSPTDNSSWTGPLAITTTCTPISVLPWTEGYEGVTTAGDLPSCWARTNGISYWNSYLAATGSYNQAAHTGSKFVSCRYGANDDLFTPGSALTAGESYDFSYWYVTDGYAGWGPVSLKMGTIQSTAGMTTTLNTIAAPMNTTYQKVTVTFTAPATDVYYFAIHVTATSGPWYMTFDDFKLQLTPQHNLAVTQIVSPNTPCGLTNAEDITISVTNYGTQPVTDPIFEYKVNNGTVVSESYTGTINSLQNISYTFSTQYDFSNYGVAHAIKAWSVFATDPDPTNDTAYATITPIASVANLTESFETFTNGFVVPFPNGWSASPATGYRWEVIAGQTSSTTTGPAVDHTLGTTAGKYIFTEASSGALNDVATLTSTCLDLSGFTLPRLSYWYHFYGSEINKMYVDVFSNGSWIAVDSIIGQQQASMTSPWLRKVISIAQPNVNKIRFRALRGNGYYGDLAIDDILIDESPAYDLKVLSWEAPIYTGCGSSGIDQIVIKVQNLGTNPITDAGVAYQVNGGTIVRDTITATLQPTDIYTFTYQQAYDFTTPGSYLVKTFIDETADIDHTNDTLVRIVNVTPMVNTYPYVDDFEGAGSYWTTGGTSSTWQHGVPAGTNINTAASGTKVWMTNLTGSYNASEASWVQGPCFDFSTIINPIVILKTNFYSEGSYDGAVLQYSLDAGTTWENVGLYNDQVNWYNDNSLSGLAWTGLEEGWGGTSTTGWRTAGHTLQTLVGESDVRFRMAFGSDGSVQYDGFAFDDFTITQAADLKPIALYSNLTGCNLNADTIRMYIKNVSAAPVSSGESIPCKYIVNTLPAVTENYVLSADLTPGDSVLFTFTQPFAFMSGNYTIKLIVDYSSDVNGINDTTQYTVSQQNIQVQIMGGDTLLINSIYLPYTLSLINLGYTYDSYLWSNEAGTVTSTTNTLDIPALGWYYVTVTNTNCTETDSIFVDELVSIPWNSADGTLSIYPNPARDIVYFKARTDVNQDIIVQLVTPDGKMIESREFKNASDINTTFNVGTLAKGLYFIKVYQGKSCYIEKISIE